MRGMGKRSRQFETEEQQSVEWLTSKTNKRYGKWDTGNVCTEEAVRRSHLGDIILRETT